MENPLKCVDSHWFLLQFDIFRKEMQQDFHLFDIEMNWIRIFELIWFEIFRIWISLFNDFQKKTVVKECRIVEEKSSINSLSLGSDYAALILIAASLTKPRSARSFPKMSHENLISTLSCQDSVVGRSVDLHNQQMPQVSPFFSQYFNVLFNWKVHL